MIVGIDLGTTNSLISYLDDDGNTTMIANEFGDYLTPSVISLTDDANIIVGKTARERLITHPTSSVANVKRFMGTDKQIKLGKKTFRAEELSALILRKLKEDAENHFGKRIKEAVITVPAYFNDSQRKATQAAGKMAGLNVERLINEPTAAALAYGLEPDVREHRSVLVFDLGGGTFDISILEIFNGIMEVHASTGDNHLGGEDFTALLAQKITDNCCEALDIKPNNVDPKLQQSILAQAEKCKIELSNNQAAKVKLIWNKKTFEQEVNEEEIDALFQPLLNRITKPIERALRDAKIRANDLSDIILVGGATQMPLIRRQVTRLFSRFPNADIDPDQVVCQGAAIQAGLKSKNQALDDVVLTDVAPYTMGIEIASQFGERKSDLKLGVYAPIIERNSYIPCSRSEVFTTIKNFQKRIDVKVFQGENARVSENVYLGMIKANIPRKRAGEEQIGVRFTYDVNGALEVEVTVMSNGQTQRQVFEENPGILSTEEIQKRFKELEKLKLHPREKAENQALISRSEREYQEALGDTRQEIQFQLTQFEAALERQDERIIRDARIALETFLHHLNDSPY